MPDDANSHVSPPVDASPQERWAWGVEHATSPSDDDTSVLIGTGGRRASRQELLSFVAREQERIARGGY